MQQDGSTSAKKKFHRAKQQVNIFRKKKYETAHPGSFADSLKSALSIKQYMTAFQQLVFVKNWKEETRKIFWNLKIQMKRFRENLNFHIFFPLRSFE